MIPINPISVLYQPYPRNYPVFAPRDKVADFLEQYAITQDLVIWTNSELLPGATYDSKSKRWTIQIDRSGKTVTLHPFHIVIATSAHSAPYTPHIQDSHKFHGETLHSSQFPGGQKFVGKRVVVLGAGNSSADICQDLSFRGAASVTMVQRSATCVVSAGVSNRFVEGSYPEDRDVEISDFKGAATPPGVIRHIPMMTPDDKAMIDGLEKVGFRVLNENVMILYLSRGGGYCKSFYEIL